MSTAPPPPAHGEEHLALTVVRAHLDAADAEGVLTALAAHLQEAGAVGEDFAEALRAREREYPTGLPTPIPTAIPHADPAHVRVPGLAVATLARPVPFGEMGVRDGRVDVHLVAMPLLTDAREHLAALQALMGLLSDEAAVRDLLEAPDDAALRERAAARLAALPGGATGAADSAADGVGESA